MNQELLEGIFAKNKRAISKAITLVESKKTEHRHLADELLNTLMPHTGKSLRIGITGVPGAGKSTFIEGFGLYAISQGKKVAVLAIDPSSQINSGSILGDKTRMEELSKNENAFIRPSPNAGFLGGIANSTYETMLICEAAGYDIILIETVGVGQSEIMVNDVCDVFLFLKILGDGDELQGIKKGVMEMVDIIFINKVDDENKNWALRTKSELTKALQYVNQKNPNWKVPILLGSALNMHGFDTCFEAIHDFISYKKEGFLTNRKNQMMKRFQHWIDYSMKQKLKELQSHNSDYKESVEEVENFNKNPRSEAEKFVNNYFK